MSTNAWQRAEMPSGAVAVLDERTLTNSNANLLTVVKPGQKVLDVGCGAGAITRGIVDLVGVSGSVSGVDRSSELITLAKEKFRAISNLSFTCADILDDSISGKYQVITIARTLQWIADPGPVVRKMISMLDREGILCVLDYDHTRIEWDPEPPPAMRFFYDAFLRWRADAGMDNAIGDNIRGLLAAQQLTILTVLDQSEYSDHTMPDFQARIALWTIVAETRGKQMTVDGYVTEEQRQKAIADYQHWCTSEARSMKLHLKATHARV